jgi:hypothetical protein
MINYNEPFKLEKDKILEFPDFKMIYTETKRENIPEYLRISPYAKEYKIISADGEKILKWGSGTGVLFPLRIKIEKSNLTFEFNPWEEDPKMKPLSP